MTNCGKCADFDFEGILRIVEGNGKSRVKAEEITVDKQLEKKR